MLAVFARAVSVSYLEDTCREHLSDYMPLDKTMPARGTHSFDPSWRGRGLRFSGSWSKAARTQSAMASASGLMVVSAGSGHGVVVEARKCWIRKWHQSPPRTFLHNRPRGYPVALLSPCETP